MAIYKFRVSFEEYDDVYRDIEIKSVQNFEQLHYAIQEAIGFDASKPASFFMSNDNWKKGEEIVYRHDTGNNSHSKALMKDSVLRDFISDPHQKIYYVFDQPSQWTFYIELVKILPDTTDGKKYPVCVKIHGDAPKQYLKIEPPKGVPDPEFMDEGIFNELGLDEEEAVEEEESGNESEEDSQFGEGVDEDEYDNIEESSEDESERE